MPGSKILEIHDRLRRGASVADIISENLARIADRDGKERPGAVLTIAARANESDCLCPFLCPYSLKKDHNLSQTGSFWVEHAASSAKREKMPQNEQYIYTSTPT